MPKRLQAARKIVGVGVGRTPMMLWSLGAGKWRKARFGDLLVALGFGFGKASARLDPMNRRSNDRDLMAETLNDL
jgi:hypothetical protein